MGVGVMGEFFIDMSLIHKEGSPERRETVEYSAQILTSAYQIHERPVGLNDRPVNTIQPHQTQVTPASLTHITNSHHS